MQEAIVVYLDSQDFSKLSDVRAGPSTLTIKDELLELKRRGIARYVFSDVLVFECLPVRIEDAHLSLARFELITELCDGDFLPPFSEIIRFELGIPPLLRHQLAQFKSSDLNWASWCLRRGGMPSSLSRYFQVTGSPTSM